MAALVVGALTTVPYGHEDVPWHTGAIIFNYLLCVCTRGSQRSGDLMVASAHVDTIALIKIH